MNAEVKELLIWLLSRVLSIVKPGVRIRSVRGEQDETVCAGVKQNRILE
jgi:hypothetical protein